MRRLMAGLAVLAVGAGASLAWSGPAQAATVDVNVTCAVGSGDKQWVDLPSHVQAGDTLRVTYQGCKWFRVITDESQQDRVTPVGTGFAPSRYTGFLLAAPTGTLTFTVNQTPQAGQALLNFLPQDAMTSIADELYLVQVSPGSLPPTATPTTPPTGGKPLRGGGYDTVIIKKNGGNARYRVTALPRTIPAVLRVKVGGDWSTYRVPHPGMGQAVELNIYKAAIQTPRPAKCTGEYCPIQIWAFRPGKRPTLVLKSRWSQYT